MLQLCVQMGGGGSFKIFGVRILYTGKWNLLRTIGSTSTTTGSRAEAYYYYVVRSTWY